MNKMYCWLISRKLLYSYFHYSEKQKRKFKKNLLRPLLKKIGNQRFWDFHYDIKKSSNQYLINCNSITKDKRRWRYLQNKVIDDLKKPKFYYVSKRKLVL